MLFRILILFILIFNFSTSTLSAQKTSSPPSIAKITDATQMKHASISIAVLDVETGKLVAGYNEDKSLSPASSIKAVTTASALAILGKDYTFKTELQYDGSINNGVLNGNIYIKGFGDPTLGAEKPSGTTSYQALMTTFVKAIQAKGIKEIQGKVIGDASFFSSQSTPSTWQWNDMGNYYGAGAWGLNINTNSYKANFRQNPKLGGTPKLESTAPKVIDAYFVNEVTSASKGSGDNCYIYGAPHQRIRFLRGTIPAGSGKFTVKGSLPDPPFTAAAMLLQELENAGIKTSKEATTLFALEQDGKTPTATRTNLLSHQSKPLWDIAKIANEESINLYCEAMLKVIGKKQKNEGSTKKGVEAVTEFWEARGVDMEGFYMMDGCGLSARNGMTTKQIATILRKIQVDNSLEFEFKDNLAIAGKTGTMKYLLKGTAAEGKIFAKTGSMDRIRSYSGFVKTKSGQLRSFCIIANNYHCSNSAARKLMEKWMLSLIAG